MDQHIDGMWNVTYCQNVNETKKQTRKQNQHFDALIIYDPGNNIIRGTSQNIPI